MLRSLEQVLHVARAVSNITGCKQLVVVGSAAVLASRRGLSDDFGTEDVDLFSLDAGDEEQFADDAEIIGMSSTFHGTYGYYADGVGPRTALMPGTWKARALEMNVPDSDGAVLWIPDVNDIALAKLCAWRDKDKEWLEIAAKEKVIDLAVMADRLSEVMQTAHRRTDPAPRNSGLSKTPRH
jgi:hypothetical protein